MGRPRGGQGYCDSESQPKEGVWPQLECSLAHAVQPGRGAGAPGKRIVQGRKAPGLLRPEADGERDCADLRRRPALVIRQRRMPARSAYAQEETPKSVVRTSLTQQGNKRS